jgi:hypothetical protein
MHQHRTPQPCDTCREWPDWARHLSAQLNLVIGLAMTENIQQAALDADVAAIGTNVATIVSELKAAIAANPGAPASSLDLTGLDALAASTGAEATTDAPAAPAA